MKNSIKFFKYPRFNFSFFKKSSMKKTIYTKPLIEGQYELTPARFVPPEIIRPSYASKTIYFKVLKEIPL